MSALSDALAAREIWIRFMGANPETMSDEDMGIAIECKNRMLAAAPDALDWIAKALPFLKLDLERRRFIDYDDSENKAYGDRDIAALTALIAKAEGTKE